MVFYFLISVVFIAELIIFIAIVSVLYKNSKKLNEWNDFLLEAKPGIAEIMKLGTKLSEQLTELAPMVTEKIKSIFQDIVYGQLKNILAGVICIAVKKEVERHISK